MTTKLPLATKERQQLFKQTAAAPRIFEQLLRNLPRQRLMQKPSHGFSLHEHMWHLADLESEGFSYRLQALLARDNPVLNNFDGDKFASERDYHALPLHQACKQYSESRLQNLWLLSGVSNADWVRSGIQVGVGDVCVVDIFRAMVAHDAAHLQEMRALVKNEVSRHLSSNVAA